MPCALWTRGAVAELIEQRFGVKLCVRTMGKYLARWGFTPQQPMKTAYEQSPAAVGQWLQQDYPAIAQRAKREGAEMHWGDERGLHSDDVRGRGFVPKGQTPVVRVNNKRHALSIISTVTNKGQMRWRIFDGVLNTTILLDFVRRLIKGQHREEIEMFYLPSHSPALDPDEMGHANIKQAVTKLAPARTKKQLVDAASKHLRSVQPQPERIRKYFQHEPVRYAA